MSRSETNDWRGKGRSLSPASSAHRGRRQPERGGGRGGADRLEDPKRLAQTAIFVTVIVVAIYFLVPQVAGFEDGLEKLGEGNRVCSGSRSPSAS